MSNTELNNRKSIKPIKDNYKLCHNCLEESHFTYTFTLNKRGYGSSYDLIYDLSLRLCDKCIDELGGVDYINSLFNELPSYDEHKFESYEHEEELENILSKLPIQSKEIIFNKEGNTFILMESQDYIDIELGIADDSVYEKYGIIL